MRLPLELRQLVYKELCLPPAAEKQWIPVNKGSLALIHTSRQIRAEASPTFWANHCFTVPINFPSSLADKAAFFTDDPKNPMSAIKHWQLKFDDSWVRRDKAFIRKVITPPEACLRGIDHKLEKWLFHQLSKLEMEKHHIQEMQICANGLTSLKNLQTLKIRIPCHCERPTSERHGYILSQLIPLRTVPVATHFSVILTRPNEFVQCPKDSCENTAWCLSSVIVDKKAKRKIFKERIQRKLAREMGERVSLLS